MKHGSGSLGEKTNVREVTSRINIHKSKEIRKGPPSPTGQLSLAEVELAPDLGTGPGLRLVSGRGRTRTQVSGTPLPVIRRQ